MRISSQQIFSGGINRLQNLNSNLQKTDEQISTGKRVINPSDDPVAAARILKLAQQTSQIEQFQRGTDLAENRLQQEESTLASITDVVQRVRELTVKAGNGALSESDRKSVAAELRERLDQLGSLANSRDASGEYIFSGFKGNTEAFGQNISGDWVYQGDEGQRQLEIDTGVKVAISDNGKGLFVDIPSNNPTFFAEASSANTSNPPARISSGMVLDQEVFNGVYPADLVVQVDATAGTFTVTDRTSGADLTPTPANYTSGESIRVAGIQFEITGAADGDNFVIKTAEKQSMFTTVEKLIYGLENQAKTPAVANIPSASFTPDADDTLTINGIDFTGLTDVASLRDAINTNNDPATAKISAELDGSGDLVITSLDGDLDFEADGGTIAGGQMVVTDTKFEDLDLQNGPLTATVASGQQAFDELIANSLVDLDNVQESILTTQTQIGGRLNAIETTRDFLTDSSVFTEQIRSEIQDVDYAEAVSRLSFQSFVLEAAQLSFAQVSRLSLFDKL